MILNSLILVLKTIVGTVGRKIKVHTFLCLFSMSFMLQRLKP